MTANRTEPTSQSSKCLIVLFFILAFSFAGSFVAAKEVLVILSPLQATAFRLGLAVILFAIFCISSQQSLRIPLKTLFKVWISGILLHSIAVSLLFWAMQFVSASIGGILESAIPIFTYLISLSVFKGESIKNIRSTVGITLGGVGIVLVFAEALNFRGSGSEFFGVMALVMMGIAFSIGSLMTREIFSKHPSLERNACVLHQTFASFIVIAVLSLTIDGLPQWSTGAFSGRILLGILYLGIFPTAVGAAIYARLLREWGSVRSAAVCYVVPVFSILLDVFFYGNIPTLIQSLGCLAILMGVAHLQNLDSKVSFWNHASTTLSRRFKFKLASIR